MQKTEKIFEIPVCSVCHEELKSNICLTQCNHIFHNEWYYTSFLFIIVLKCLFHYTLDVLFVDLEFKDL